LPVRKWLVIARNEYRIRTSKIRKIRPYFPFLVVGVLAVYVGLIAPALVSFFIDDFLLLLLSEGAVATVQIILFMIFIYFIMLPIMDTLREEQTGQLEIFLAAPVKPSDVLLGEFLGETPYYAIFVTVITGFFTSLMAPLGLSAIQIATVVMIFVLTFLSALWIGTVVAAVLRTRLGKTARGRDVGRGLAMLIALPMVALVYAMIYGDLLSLLTRPQAGGIGRIALELLPSSWGAEIIAAFASGQSNVGADVFQIGIRFGGLVLFFVLAVWLGSKVANRAYNLEPTTFTSSKAKPDGTFYRAIKGLGGGKSFGTLLVSLFKDYGRRLENLSNIIYIGGILVLINIFIIPNISTESNGPPIAWVMSQFTLPFLAVMVAAGVSVQGKNTIFIFKKSPSGVARLVETKLVQSWLVVIPITVAITALTAVLNPQPVISWLTSAGLLTLIVAANVAFVIGLFLLNPAYSPKSVKLWLNLMITIFASIGLFVASLSALTIVSPGASGGMLDIQLLQVALNWVLGIVFLVLGKKKLNRME
jgi:hypothetical protein